MVFRARGSLDRRHPLRLSRQRWHLRCRGTTRRSSTYLKPEVREAVIQTILHVARQFPIIRFDAAMTLTRKRHFQRLWFPEPGSGGAIPSRAEHGLSAAEFDAAMPHEFWREVVDRVAAEAPDTLLLAEAFWLMEGYFVRTLGMHRVYNSAFMNMLRDEENANYRSVIKNTIEFDPESAQALRQLHEQSRRAHRGGPVRQGRQVFRRLHPDGHAAGAADVRPRAVRGPGRALRHGVPARLPRRGPGSRRWSRATSARSRRCSIAALCSPRCPEFLLYDFFTDDGWVNEDVFAYSNRSGDARALVVYHNRYANTRGWIRVSSGYAEKAPDGGRRLRHAHAGRGLRTLVRVPGSGRVPRCS